MEYEFDKNLKKVTVVATHSDDILDIEELWRVANIIDIEDVEYITRPLLLYSVPRVVIHTVREDGVTDLKYMAMSRTFKPFKLKTANKD